MHMRAHKGSAAVQRTLAIGLALVALAWFIAVPTVVTTWNFFFFAGLLTALGWVVKTTYLNGQPASSLAQVLHDADHRGAHAVPKDNR